MSATRTKYEMLVADAMASNDYVAVQSALDCERALMMFGSNFSQTLIDQCTDWLLQHYLNKKVIA